MDGCGLFQNLTRITVPLMTPVLATCLIFNFQGVWSEFYWALIQIRDENLKTLPLGLMNFQSQFNTDYGILCAGLAISIIPVLLVYLKCSSLSEMFVPVHRWNDRRCGEGVIHEENRERPAGNRIR